MMKEWLTRKRRTGKVLAYVGIAAILIVFVAASFWVGRPWYSILVVIGFFAWYWFHTLRWTIDDDNPRCP